MEPCCFCKIGMLQVGIDNAEILFLAAFIYLYLMLP